MRPAPDFRERLSTGLLPILRDVEKRMASGVQHPIPVLIKYVLPLIRRIITAIRQADKTIPYYYAYRTAEDDRIIRALFNLVNHFDESISALKCEFPAFSSQFGDGELFLHVIVNHIYSELFQLMVIETEYQRVRRTISSSQAADKEVEAFFGGEKPREKPRDELVRAYHMRPHQAADKEVEAFFGGEKPRENPRDELVRYHMRSHLISNLLASCRSICPRFQELSVIRLKNHYADLPLEHLNKLLNILHAHETQKREAAESLVALRQAAFGAGAGAGAAAAAHAAEVGVESGAEAATAGEEVRAGAGAGAAPAVEAAAGEERIARKRKRGKTLFSSPKPPTAARAAEVDASQTENAGAGISTLGATAGAKEAGVGAAAGADLPITASTFLIFKTSPAKTSPGRSLAAGPSLALEAAHSAAIAARRAAESGVRGPRSAGAAVAAVESKAGEEEGAGAAPVVEEALFPRMVTPIQGRRR